jgi:hypothetical protein
MFRLMKLLAYALFGYALYEFVRGMSGTAAMGGGQGSMAGGSSRAFGVIPGEGQMTGPAEGREEATLDNDGGSVRHRVGRGVVSQ